MSAADRNRPAASGQPYEELRSRLVSKGYLERPLDRFVLAGVSRSGSFAGRHAIVSLRIAFAAGPLLGILFALAVVVVNKPRLSGIFDPLLLAAYFSLVFGGIVFALEFAAGLVLAALVRMRKRGVGAVQAASARAGLAVSLVLSAYLALWWRRRAGGGDDPWLDLAGLLALIAVNGALLRVSSLASLAALIRVSDLPVELPRRAKSGRASLTIAASVLLVLGFFLAPRGTSPGGASPFEASPPPGRLLVVAWDGVPPDLFQDWVALGASGLLERWGPDHAALTSLGPVPEREAQNRPEYWIGIATGRRSAEHGVGGVTDERLAGLSSPLGDDPPLITVLHAFVPGRMVAVSAGVRRAPTIWEILGEREGVGAVGWWATWPAAPPELSDPGPPFQIVTDRAILALQKPVEGDYRIAPPSLARELGRSFRQDIDRARAGSTAFLGALPPGLKREADQPALIDGYAAEIGVRLTRNQRLSDVFVYLPGLDILRSAGPGQADQPPVLRSYIDLAGARIAYLASALSPADWLVVIGDSGRGGTGREGRKATLPAGSYHGTGGSAGTGSALTDGTAGSAVTQGGPVGSEGTAGPDPGTGRVLILGPGVEPLPGGGETWSALDLAPTLLNLRGFPRSREMKGRTQTSFLRAEWRQRLVPREIETFGQTPIPALPAGPAPAEEEILERLRSLGYVQ